MTHSSFVLRFIRDFDKSSVDDVLRITPSYTSSALFNVVYTDHYSNVRNEVEQTARDVLEFVEDILTLLPLDEDPFKCIQMDAPTFPSVMIDVARLKVETVQKTILDILKRTLSDYPVKGAVRRHPTDALRNAAPLTA